MRLNATFHRAYFLVKPRMNPGFLEIFFDSGSMTKNLKELSKQRLTLKVLKHHWQKPKSSESEILSLSKEWGIGREVVMSGAGKPWLYGRVYFPESVVKAHGNNFLFLGEKPLGEILFSHPQIRRSNFSVARLTSVHREYQDAALALEQSPEYLWARRSEFYMPTGAISLLEVFSPGLESVANNKWSKK